MKILVLALAALIASCGVDPTVQSEPTSHIQLGEKVELWSTFYFIPMVASKPKGYPIRDPNSKIISGNLSLEHWCLGGLQGSIAVDGVVYGYSRPSLANRVPCEQSFMSRLSYASATGRIKFTRDPHPYGTGNRNNPLTPFKSIACDQSKYSFGQQFFIPKAKGCQLPDGTIHDGIFICEDVGGAIKDDQIDTFIGLVDYRGKDMTKKWWIASQALPQCFRSYVRSNVNETFEAYLVE